MASSTFSDIPAPLNERNPLNNTLIIIVNNDGTLSVDQETLHNLLAEQENTSTTAVRLIRLGVTPEDHSRNSSDSDDSDSSHVNITVEGYYPPSMVQSYQHNSDDVVDPFLGMDPEEMERLESALQSDQAKQILGEDVAAMLDILTVDDGVMSSTQLSDSVKMDHCYTNRVQAVDTHYATDKNTYGRSAQQTQSASKIVGRPRKEARHSRGMSASSLIMVQQIKSINPPLVRMTRPPVKAPPTNKIVSRDGVLPSGSVLKKKVSSVPVVPVAKQAGPPISITEEMLNEKMKEIQRSTDDYTNMSGDDQSEDKSNSSVEPSVDVEESVDSKLITQAQKMQQGSKKVIIKGGVGKYRFVDTTNGIGSKTNDSVNTKELNAETIMKPVINSQIEIGEEDKPFRKQGIKVYSKVRPQTKHKVLENVNNPPKTVEVFLPTSPHAIKKNYPRRENRKPPAHLLEVFNGPALFSVPDVPRRVSLDSKGAREFDKMPNDALSLFDGAFDEDMFYDDNNVLKSGEELPSQLHVSGDRLNEPVLTKRERRRSSSGSLETDKLTTTARRKSDEMPAKVKGKSPRQSIELNESNDGMTDAMYDALTTEDDPNKLWCICKKPHNNRFMICCDSCEDWFHGVCVGVTKALGKAMEEKGNEWTCPNCKKNKNKDSLTAIQAQKQTKITTFMNKQDTTPDVQAENFPLPQASTSSMICIVCKNPARSNSIYCSDACILKHAQNSGSSSVPSKPTLVATQLKPLALKQSGGKIIANMKKPVPLAPAPASTAAQANSLKAWLNVNPTIKVIQTPSNSSPLSGAHLVVMKHSPVPTSRPKQAQLIAPKPMPTVVLKVQGKQPGTVSAGIKVQKSVTVKQDSAVSTVASSKVQTVVKAGPSGTKEKATPQKVDVKRLSHLDSAKKDEKKHLGPDPVRLSVQKTLHELLSTRIQECDDLKSVTDEKVKRMALHIEEELFAFFKDTGMKYKSKYRSLIFNIKDPKNLTLFRKIAEKSITPHQLVRLSPDEMASQELAQWREREAQHELDMIKKNELDLLALSKTYVMKTHKGEQVIESEDGVKNDDHQLANLDPADIVSSQTSVTSTVSDGSLDVQEKQWDTKKVKTKSKESKRSKSHKASKDKGKNRKKEGRSHKSSHSKSKHHSKHHHDSSRKKTDESKVDKVGALDKELGEKENDNICTGNDNDSDVGDERIMTPVMDAVAINEMILGKPCEESDADREPTSTVTIRTPDINSSDSVQTSLPVTVWKGFAEMYDVAKFFTTIQVVSGDSQSHCESLPPKLDIVGRITPELVWAHVLNMKKTGSYEIMVVRLTAKNEDEKIPYVTLYSYLHSRNRLGVVGSKGVVGPVSPLIKDFYILPLSNHSPVPQVLLPLNGPGLEDSRPHLLLGILIARCKKRFAPVPSLPSKVARMTDTADVSMASARSFTPPIPDDNTSSSPPSQLATSKESSAHVTQKRKETSSYEEELAAIKSRVSNLMEVDDDAEPYSPGQLDEGEDLVNTPESPTDLQRKVEELNRKIAEQKLEIESMSSVIVGDPPVAPTTVLSVVTEEASETVDENEAYSPSASITPPLQTRHAIPFIDKDSVGGISNVSQGIALPSNLHEILANIKKQTETATKMDLKLDPIVQSYNARKEEEREKEESLLKAAATHDSVSYVPSTIKKSSEVFSAKLPVVEPVKSSGTLSKLSDAELIEKAAAMEREIIADIPVTAAFIQKPPVSVPIKKPLISIPIKKAPVKYTYVPPQVQQPDSASASKLTMPLVNIPLPGDCSMPPLPAGGGTPPNVRPPLPPGYKYNVMPHHVYPPLASPPNIPPPPPPPLPPPKFNIPPPPFVPYPMRPTHCAIAHDVKRKFDNSDITPPGTEPNPLKKNTHQWGGQAK